MTHIKCIRYIVLLVFLLLLLTITGNADTSYDLSIGNIPSIVTPGGGSFSFDVYLNNPATSYMGWSFYLLVQGQSSQGGVDFNLSVTANSKNDSNYVFYGNSYDYQCANVSGAADSITCSGLSNDLSTLNSGGLLAHVTVDYAALATGTYNIIMGYSIFNSLIDESFSEKFGGPTEGTVLGTFAIVP